jgi:hypothetical protein
MSLSPISKEQSHIVEVIKTGKNIQIDAVAGSGKTTTSLHIAKQYPEKQILLLTYNAKLRIETRRKSQALGLTHLEVLTYHAFAVKYMDRTAFNDNNILAHLRSKKSSETLALLSPISFDIVIVDEAQDMNFIYYELVLQILRNLTPSTQLIVMGDRKQSIYAFNRANSRFLTKAPQIYKGEFAQARLSISYRITKPMTDFLNKCCAGTLPIEATKNGPLVKYIVSNTFQPVGKYEIDRFIAQGYSYDDIFVLAPSVKSEKSPVRVLANALTDVRIPIYVPVSDDEVLDADVLRGKVVFSSFHQVKGLERAIVLVYNFDDSYFKFYARDEDPASIPNTLYVATTRASHALILFHDEANDYMPFLNKTRLSMICNVQFQYSRGFKGFKSAKPLGSKINKINATDLLKFLPVDIIADCMERVEKIQITSGGSILKIESKVFNDSDKNLCESVSEINGIAIPSYFEKMMTGRMSIQRHLTINTLMDIQARISKQANQVPDKGVCLIGDDAGYSDDDEDDSDADDDDKSVKPLDHEMTDVEIRELLQLSTQWCCDKSGFTFKKSQIRKYDWIPATVFKIAHQRLTNLFALAPCSTMDQFEFEVQSLVFCGTNMAIVGFMDLIYTCRTIQNLYEFKVVNELTNEHVLQVVIYMWLCMKNARQIANAYLYNIVTDQLIKIKVSIENLNYIADTLIRHKSAGLEIQTDNDFIDECLAIYNKFG